MGVPKFFRWLSERYPLINQPIHCPPDEETKQRHGYPASDIAKDRDPNKDSSPANFKRDHRRNTNLPHIMPEFDRLYLDMNGIIHCSSHNNSEEELEKQEKDGEGNGEKSGDDAPRSYGVPPITEDQIFQNVCYYLDRIIGDIVQPKQLVFLAIDGVAPRAKLNQQRSRRYRSGTEEEIEMHLMTLQRVQEGKEDEMDAELSKEFLIEADGGAFEGYRPHPPRERFSGTIDTGSSTTSVSTRSKGALDADGVPGFHSNEITPGTPFLHKCSQRILEFIREKLQTDPKWQDLTLVFSGHDVPGEGEHKILEFIRSEKHKPGYDPNTSHCIFGQDGDLMMLGLATHEPHTCLLREEVVFDPGRRKAIEKLAKIEHGKRLEEIERDNEDDGGSNSSLPPLSAAVQGYIHNANFELLHISVLREYLGLEFEVQEFFSNSKFELEPTIDDFVFMTFFVGNDFLPHMPALDIGDEAFDLLFYAYKKNRGKWLKDGQYRRSVAADNGGATGGPKYKTINHPYMTDAGTITSGTRLESFLADLGSYEDPYYHNKRESLEDENERMRKMDEKAGRESLIPPQEVLDQVEAAGKELYHEMLLKSSQSDEDAIGVTEGEAQLENEEDEGGFKPVMSNEVPNAALVKKLGGALRGSLSPVEGGVAKVESEDNSDVDDNSLVDLKGRYYWDKFEFSPFDAEKHLALRKAYIAGLVWNLEYYYKGVVSWEWYYPYSYGPMLSDLVNINSILEEVSFFGGEDATDNSGMRQVAGEPLKPFEQLLACLPPSSSYLLPEPYRWLMSSPDSPLIDFYPESFTVDMNGKRWPWEAVTLLPFINAKKLVEASQSLVDTSKLSDEEKKLNEFGETHVLTRSSGTIEMEPLNESMWAIKRDADVAFQPQLSEGTEIPGDCFPTLKDAPITGLNRRKVFLNVFGLRSRYRTALLEMRDDLPAFPPTQLLANKFIGTTINFRYPILYEGFVCSIADSTTVYRGNEKPQKYSEEGQAKRPALIKKMFKELEIGEGMTGTGGWVLPHADITLTVRPLTGIETLPDGTKVKVYAQSEIEIPFVSALFSPSKRDPRLDVPAKLEKNPFAFGGQTRLDRYLVQESGANITNKLDILSESYSKDIGAKKMSAAGSSRGFATLPAMRNTSYGANATRPLPKGRTPPRRSFHSAANMARRGGPRHRVVGTAGAMAMSAFFFAACLLQAHAKASVIAGVAKTMFFRKAFAGHPSIDDPAPSTSQSVLMIRGGGIEQYGEVFEPQLTPPIEFAHGTTTLSFVFQGGIVAAVDSRASIGNFVGSKTTQKVLPVSKNILGTMAGGAADCSYWIRFLRSEAKMHELLHEGRGISVARASRLISNILYQYRGLDLSVGTMIMGYHPRDGFGIYYVDNTGVRIEGDMFAVGSGSTFALGILDTEERRFDMSEEEAVSLGIKAIRHATMRDAMSGGYIGVYLITADGWRKVFSEDLASIR